MEGWIDGMSCVRSMEEEEEDVEMELTPLEWPEVGVRVPLRFSEASRASRARESARAVSCPPSCLHSYCATRNK